MIPIHVDIHSIKLQYHIATLININYRRINQAAHRSETPLKAITQNIKR